jgi:hypothetical protein
MASRHVRGRQDFGSRWGISDAVLERKDLRYRFLSVALEELNGSERLLPRDLTDLSQGIS